MCVEVKVPLEMTCVL